MMIQENIKIIISNSNSKIIAGLNNVSGIVSIYYSNPDSLLNTSNMNTMELTTIDIFNEFHYRLKKIVEHWETNYKGSGDLNWELVIDSSLMKKKFLGNGSVPTNWNEFLDLISEMELLFKNLKNSEKKEKENNDYITKCLDDIKGEVDNMMMEQGLIITDENGKKWPRFGSCHTRWEIEKKILKERFNIDWQTPAEKNPFINYD